jgi:WD40-like Beta Propeller Repeat
MKKVFLFLIILLTVQLAGAQNQPLWLRYPAISPDGNTIAFGYKGDIYLVDAKGGVARPLTIHEAHDMMPIWSHDSKTIAFASDRYGNFDVFTVPASVDRLSALLFIQLMITLLILLPIIKLFYLEAEEVLVLIIFGFIVPVYSSIYIR